MLEKIGQLKNGYNPITEINNKHINMLMDIGVYSLTKGQTIEISEETKEVAVLILDGELNIKYNNQTETMKRNCVFDQKPYCLHASNNTKIIIEATENCELIIQKTDNTNNFSPVFYTPETIQETTLGEGVWEDSAKRILRTVFDYTNAPYSNMVMGEVINLPGRWSSYIPHHHPQPEVYFYKFSKPQGFGCSFIGENAYTISNNSYSIIEGGLTHPQVTAPGYKMYYCWMIRHLEDNPWTSRINDENHTWLL